MVISKKSNVLVVLFSFVFVSLLNASNEPLIIEHPKDIAECIGGVGELKIAVKEGIKATIQWQKSTNKRQWANILNANANTYMPDANTPGKMWYRAVIITDGAQPEYIKSQPAEVTIAEALSVRVELPKNSTICTDEKLTLIATHTGGAGECVLQWQISENSGKDWSDIKGANSDKLVIREKVEVNKQYRARYRCSGSGCCN